jgi:hypothetical protein
LDKNWLQSREMNLRAAKKKTGIRGRL